MDARIELDIIKLDLSIQEAVVLFDWISRFNKLENSNLIEDQAEERILWDIESSLETTLSEILVENYKALLKKARDQIRD